MRRKEKHTFYNYQFKHTAVKITDHPNIQSVDVAEALGIHPIMLYRRRQEMREGKIRFPVNPQERTSNQALHRTPKRLAPFFGAAESRVMCKAKRHI